MRPVEELMGWERFRSRWSNDPLPLDPIGFNWITPEGKQRNRAEVDDLADWLVEQTDSIEIGGPWTVVATGEGSWEVQVHEAYETLATGPTLRDAFEAAVRAVCDDRGDQ